MLKYSVGSKTFIPKLSVFKGGEVNVQLSCGQSNFGNETVAIQARITNAETLLQLLMLNDALKIKHGKYVKIALFLPYIPYARQDRVCNDGESFTLKVFANLINSCNFESVYVLDPHSDVSVALINNCIVCNQYSEFGKLFTDWSNITIIAPDAGAYKKAYSFASKVGAKDVIAATKVRNLETGEIIKYVIEPKEKINHAVVLDDIIDGGRTFIELAANIRQHCTKLDLVVTHGIFSYGYETIASIYDNVYTTDSFKTKEDVPATLTNIHIKEIY